MGNSSCFIISLYLGFSPAIQFAGKYIWIIWSLDNHSLHWLLQLYCHVNSYSVDIKMGSGDQRNFKSWCSFRKNSIVFFFHYVGLIWSSCINLYFYAHMMWSVVKNDLCKANKIFYLKWDQFVRGFPNLNIDSGYHGFWHTRTRAKKGYIPDFNTEARDKHLIKKSI